MIKFKNDQYEIGITITYKYFMYHFRYMRFQKRWDIGRQIL